MGLICDLLVDNSYDVWTNNCIGSTNCHLCYNLHCCRRRYLAFVIYNQKLLIGSTRADDGGGGYHLTNYIHLHHYGSLEPANIN